MPSLSADITLIAVTAGCVLLAIAAMIYAARVRLASAGGGERSRWKRRASELDQRLSSMDSVFTSYPGLILVWEESASQLKSDLANANWGSPRMYGSPAALASVARFAEIGKQKGFATRILDSLADMDTIGEVEPPLTLRANLTNLRSSGRPFSVSIVLPGGNVIEADGRPAGRQVVLWLEDASIRGEDERTAINRFETHRLTAKEDPIAFVEMMSRAPFPLWRMSGTGTITWVNDAYVHAVGAQSLAGVIEAQTHLDSDAQAQLMGCLQSGEPSENTRPIVINGARKAMNVSVFPVSGGAAGIAMDASEADKLREALTRHIRSHDELLNTMEEAIVIFGADKRMTFHNTAFAKLFKLDDKWFNDRPGHSEWLDSIRERRLLPEQSDFAGWKAGELSLYTDWPDEMPPEIWSLPNGTTLRLARLRDPRGGISLLFSDITQTVTLQGQLGTLINVQKTTLDKLSEGIAVFGTDGRLKLFNSAFARMWNLNAQQLDENPRFQDITEDCLPLYHDKAFGQR